MLDQTTYDPYGNTTDSMPVQASAFEFTGRENDGNSFYYMRGRYYSPSIARFISRDPAGLAGGLNMYTYAGDSPTNFTDPTGTTVETGEVSKRSPWYGLGSADSVSGFEMVWPHCFSPTRAACGSHGICLRSMCVRTAAAKEIQ